MYGCRSRSLIRVPYDPEIERTLHQQARKAREAIMDDQNQDGNQEGNQQ